MATDLSITHERMGFCYAEAKTDAGVEWVKQNINQDPDFGGKVDPRYFAIGDVRMAIDITLGAIRDGLNVMVNGQEVYEGTNTADGEPVVLVRI